MEATESDGSLFYCAQGLYALQMDSMNMSSSTVKGLSLQDPVLSRVRAQVLRGWTHSCDDAELRPYWRNRDEINIEDDILMRGSRVIIPQMLRKTVIDELHLGHIGIVKMKHMARQHVWWPGIDTDIKNITRTCDACRLTRNNPPTEYHMWERPQKPWERINIDFAGPVENKMFMVVVDAYSNWLEIIDMSKNTTTNHTIDVLRTLFARWGLPIQLHSDNAPQFKSREMRSYAK